MYQVPVALESSFQSQLAKATSSWSFDLIPRASTGLGCTAPIHAQPATACEDGRAVYAVPAKSHSAAEEERLANPHSKQIMVLPAEKL